MTRLTKEQKEQIIKSASITQKRMADSVEDSLFWLYLEIADSIGVPSDADKRKYFYSYMRKNMEPKILPFIQELKEDAIKASEKSLEEFNNPNIGDNDAS